MTLIRIFAVAACIAASPLTLAAAPDERYIVQYSEGADTTVRKAIEHQGGRIMRALATRQLFAAELPPGLAKQLASRGDIRLIEPDPKRGA